MYNKVSYIWLNREQLNKIAKTNRFCLSYIQTLPTLHTTTSYIDAKKVIKSFTEQR